MNNKKNLLPIIAVAIFSFAIVSFIVYSILNKNKEDIIDTDVTGSIPTSAPIITEIPTPTIAQIDKDIKIQVLNATNPPVNGLAATFKAKLVSLGFENVEAGTASTKSTENSVQVKSADISAYFKSILATDFPATYTTDLKETATYDAVFMIGTDISSTTSATPTDAEELTVTPTTKVTTTPTEAEE